MPSSASLPPPPTHHSPLAFLFPPSPSPPSFSLLRSFSLSTQNEVSVALFGEFSLVICVEKNIIPFFYVTIRFFWHTSGSQQQTKSVVPQPPVFFFLCICFAAFLRHCSLCRGPHQARWVAAAARRGPSRARPATPAAHHGVAAASLCPAKAFVGSHGAPLPVVEEPPERKNDAAMRMPVSGVYKVCG